MCPLWGPMVLHLLRERVEAFEAFWKSVGLGKKTPVGDFFSI